MPKKGVRELEAKKTREREDKVELSRDNNEVDDPYDYVLCLNKHQQDGR